MDWKQYVSVAAFAFSLVSFGFTYTLSSTSAVTSVRPVLIFEYTQTDGWTIRNVGNGPALNILVAIKSDGKNWTQPARIPPLQKDGRLVLHWVGNLNVQTLGSSYDDIAGRTYSSTCSEDLTRTFETNQLPAWAESQIQAHWKLAPVK